MRCHGRKALRRSSRRSVLFPGQSVRLEISPFRCAHKPRSMRPVCPRGYSNTSCNPIAGIDVWQVACRRRTNGRDSSVFPPGPVTVVPTRSGVMNESRETTVSHLGPV